MLYKGPNCDKSQQVLKAALDCTKPQNGEKRYLKEIDDQKNDRISILGT